MVPVLCLHLVLYKKKVQNDKSLNNKKCAIFLKQGCGSGFGLDPDPLGIRIPDPDPGARKLRSFSRKMPFLVIFFLFTTKKE
jgi:hypothetical protein